MENWNKHDAAGVAALYAKDGVHVSATGVKSGLQEIEQAYQSAMKTFPQHNGQTIEQISPLGNNADIRIGEFHLSGQGENGPTELDGRYTAVDVRERGDMENPSFNLFSDPAARTGCEVGSGCRTPVRVSAKGESAGSIPVPGMAGIGASSSLPDAPVKVPSQSDLPTFVMVYRGRQPTP